MLAMWAVRRMVASAKAYLADEVEFMHCYYSVTVAHRDVYWFSRSARLKALCDEWLQMVERCRNEWGFEEHPISEEQFKEWLVKQL